MSDKAGAILERLLGLPPILLLPLAVLVLWSPFLVPLLVVKCVSLASPTLRRHSGGKAYHHRSLARVGILVIAAAIIAGVHLFSRTSAPLLIYSEGPVPNSVDRIAYDLTLEPDGSLLVTEEITLDLDRDPRALFRPLRRDQPVTVLSFTEDGQPEDTRVWIGPQYGIRLGFGTPSGTHLYKLTYRLEGATRNEIYAPNRFSGPGFSTCLSDLCTETPIQRVHWRPVTWKPVKEQVFTWHFPQPLTLKQLGDLNGKYTWLGNQPQQLDERTLQFRDGSPSYTATPAWVSEIAVPAGMSEARLPQGSLTPSLPVFVIPLLALLGVIITRLRVGGRPRGRPTLKAEYAPPDGLTAAQIAELTGARQETFVATAIADGAYRGALRVDQLRHRRPLMPDQLDDEFIATGGKDALPAPERRFVEQVTRGQERIRFSQLDQRCWTAAGALESDLHTSLTDAGYYSRRRELQRALTWLLAILLLLGGPYAMFFLGNQVPALLPVSGSDGADALRFTEPALIAWTLAAAFVALYATMIPTITAKGALARSQALGFAEYLRTAEMGPVAQDLREGYASRFLPYAVAFGLAPDLIERWRGLAARPESEEDRRRTHTTGAARFGDENVERWRLLYPPERETATTGERGERI